MTAAVNVASLGTAMSADSSGNVGVGTTTPNSKLTSQTATTSTSVFSFANQLNNSYGSNDSIAALGFHNRADVNATGVGGAIAFSGGGVSAGSGNLIFCIKGTGAIGNVVAPSDEKMRISSTGNVSVGTLFDLSYKMALVSTSTSSPSLYLRSTAAGDAGTAQLRLIKADNTNNTSQIFVQFVVDGNNTGSGQINANGASQAAFGSFSDARLKENIVDLPLQLSNITALRPVEFDYKDGCGHQIGFIAQEMQQVYPDAIGVGENEMLTITGWSKTEARLVKAIQELKAIVDAQAARITALEAP